MPKAMLSMRSLLAPAAWWRSRPPAARGSARRRTARCSARTARHHAGDVHLHAGRRRCRRRHSLQRQTSSHSSSFSTSRRRGSGAPPGAGPRSSSKPFGQAPDALAALAALPALVGELAHGLRAPAQTPARTQPLTSLAGQAGDRRRQLSRMPGSVCRPRLGSSPRARAQNRRMRRPTRVAVDGAQVPELERHGHAGLVQQLRAPARPARRR